MDLWLHNGVYVAISCRFTYIARIYIPGVSYDAVKRLHPLRTVEVCDSHIVVKFDSVMDDNSELCGNVTCELPGAVKTTQVRIHCEVCAFIDALLNERAEVAAFPREINK